MVIGTKETIDLTNKMAERGAHAALVVTPAFFKSRMNSGAMLRHYTRVSITTNKFYTKSFTKFTSTYQSDYRIKFIGWFLLLASPEEAHQPSREG